MRLAKDALTRGAPSGAPGGQEPLAGVGYSQRAVVWVRSGSGSGTGAEAARGVGRSGREELAATAAGLPAPLRQWWGPVTVAAMLPGDGARLEGAGAAAAVPDAMEQF